jgi:type I restriction enzyme R subunit
MNQGIREKELPEKFATNDYQVLLVADKYQTGFDQPLLHTMYVDKRLAGIQAVQTLSRLNRTHPQKEDTFILDFVNKPEEIREAFHQFYEGAELGQEAEPAQLYQLKNQLDASGIYLSEEIKRFCAIYFKPKQRQNPSDHQGMNAALDPAVERFRALYEQDIEEAELWRRKLTAFRNLYSFLSQIIPYQDSDLEQIYIFLRHLSPKLLRNSNEAQYDFDSDIQLEYYRLQKISEGSIHLEKGKKSPIDGPNAVGTTILRESSVKLSQLIDLLNSRFGTDFNQADQLFFDQIVEAASNSEELKQAAQVNSSDKFTLLFNQIVESLFIERVDQNEDIFARYMNDINFKKLVSDWLVSEVYKRLSQKISNN